MTSLAPDSAEVLAADQPAIAAGRAAVAAVTPQRFSSKRAYAQTFAAMVAIRCAGVLTGVLAARLLGPTGRGELAVIIFLPMLLVPVGELELSRSIIYEASKLDRVPDNLVATGFWLALILGSVQALVLAAILHTYLPADKLHLLFASRWFMLYLPAAYITSALMGIDQGRGRFGRFSFLLSLPGILYLAAILLAWLSGWISPQAFALGLLAGTVGTALVRAGMDSNAVFRMKPDWAIAQRLIKRGINFYLPAIAGFMLFRADMFLLVRLVPTPAIGFYAVAQAIALGQIGTVNPFLQVGFAAVAGEKDGEGALKTLAHHFRLAQLAVVSVGLLAAATTPWLIRLMFGARFTGAVNTAYLLIGSTVLWGMEQVLEQGLRAAGHPRPGIVSNLLGLAVLVGLGIPGCVDHGIVGLAAAALAAQLLNLVILIGFCVVGLKMSAKSFWAYDASAFKEIRALARCFIKRIFAASAGAT